METDIENRARMALRKHAPRTMPTRELTEAIVDTYAGEAGAPTTQTIATRLSSIARANPDIIAKAEPFIPTKGYQKGKVCHRYTWKDNPDVELPIKRETALARLPNTQSNDTSEALLALGKRVAELERRVYLIMDAPFNPEG